MKIFFSESKVDYSTYTFNYAIYCVKEQQAELPQIYNKGFLPYSNTLTLERDVFYLARSLRVDLERFSDTSENRRIHRKIEPLNIQLKVIPKTDFDLTDSVFQKFCLNYASERFSNNSMDEARFNYVIQRPIATHLLEYRTANELVGYVLAVIEGDMMHYWYAFFETKFLAQFPIGKWIMWRTISWAKENGLSNVYLGTCYGETSLYKTRDFRGLTFFDGTKWNEDIKLLKTLCKTDKESLPSDRFKLITEQNEFLAKL